MADEQTKGQTITVPMKRAINPSRITIYANNTNLLATQWDIQLTFGVIHEVQQGEFVSVDQALVIMTPEHARKVAEILTNVVKDYEKTQGAVRDIKSPHPPAAEHGSAGQ